MDISKPVTVDDGIYWVGSSENKNELHCNAYLIIDDGEAVLIDPGSVLDFEEVYEKVIALKNK